MNSTPESRYLSNLNVFPKSLITSYEDALARKPKSGTKTCDLWFTCPMPYDSVVKERGIMHIKRQHLFSALQNLNLAWKTSKQCWNYSPFVRRKLLAKCEKILATIVKNLRQNIIRKWNLEVFTRCLFSNYVLSYINDDWYCLFWRGKNVLCKEAEV